MRTFCMLFITLASAVAAAARDHADGIAGPASEFISPYEHSAIFYADQAAGPEDSVIVEDLLDFMDDPDMAVVMDESGAVGDSEDFMDLPVIVVDSENLMDGAGNVDGQLDFMDDPDMAGDSTDVSEKFAWRQLAVPAALVTVGQFGTWEPHARNVNNAVRDQFARWRGDHYFHADDYVQYLPSVSYLGLGAAGVPAKHGFPERAIVLGTSWLAMGILVNSVKYTVREKRPDASTRNSFPSGHTATAFMGAELVRREYGTGYGIAAYSVAAGIGVLRIWNDRHWLGDVLAGAGIGILSAEIGWWLLPSGRRLFGVTGKRQGPSFAVAPSYDTFTRTGGLALNLVW